MNVFALSSGDLVIPAMIIFVTTGLLLWRNSRVFTTGLIILAVVSGLWYFIGTKQKAPHYLHGWDLYHTVLSVKYFPELQYDKLYECTIVFDDQTEGTFGNIMRARELKENLFVPREILISESDCDERFTPDRKEAFLRDLSIFTRDLLSEQERNRLFVDYGYHGSPFFTMILTPLLSGEQTITKFWLLAGIDLVLIFLSFFMIWKHFGRESALLSFIFFCTFLPNNFFFMGGSILRFDYVFLLIMSICSLKRERYGETGMWLGLATSSRPFMIAYAIALGMKTFWNKRIFTLSFVGTLLLAIILSSLVFGYQSWGHYFMDLLAHSQLDGNYSIGLKSVWNSVTDFQNSWVFLFTSSILLLATAYFLRKKTDVEYFILIGTLAFYLLFNITRYYYGLFFILLLLPTTVVSSFFLSSIILIGAYFSPTEGFTYETIISVSILAYFAKIFLTR